MLTNTYSSSVIELVDNARLNLLSCAKFNPSSLFQCRIDIKVDIGNPRKYSISFSLTQQEVGEPRPFYESTFTEGENNTTTPNERFFLDILNCIADRISAPENIRLEVILTEAEPKSSATLIEEVKRSVEWHYALSLLKKMTDFQIMKKGALRNWSEICVKLQNNKKLSLNDALCAINQHLFKTVSPYIENINSSSLTAILSDKSKSPTEMALILRLITSNEDFLSNYCDTDCALLCNFLWNEDNVPLLSSKVDFFRLYLPNSLLFKITKLHSSNTDFTFNIFNITTVCLRNHKKMIAWSLSNKIQKEQVDYIAHTFGNEGYYNQEHYQDCLNILKNIYLTGVAYTKEAISKKIIVKLKVSEFYYWSSLSGETILSIAFNCFPSKNENLMYFSQGVMMQAGLNKCLPLIMNKEQAELVCQLFHSDPLCLISMLGGTNLRVSEILLELVFDLFE